MGMLQLFGSLLLLQLQLVGASCETCPPPEDISPCRCEASALFEERIDLYCVDVSVKETDAALEQLRGKTFDTVMIMNVISPDEGRLPSDVFRNTSVRSLKIMFCDLQGLSDSEGSPPFIGLENSLEVLEVSVSIKRTNSLKTLDLSHLKHLYELTLSGNNIPEIGNDWFAKGPLSLTRLFIVDCGLNKIGDKAFAPLVNLQTFSLWDNRLTSFERSMIANPISHIRTLSFMQNNLTSLPDDIFSGMPSLQIVQLKENFIRRIEEKTWVSVWGQFISEVDLRENPLVCDSHMEWAFKRERPPRCWGTCDSPEHEKGVSLADFIDSNQKSPSASGKSYASVLNLFILFILQYLH